MSATYDAPISQWSIFVIEADSTSREQKVFGLERPVSVVLKKFTLSNKNSMQLSDPSGAYAPPHSCGIVYPKKLLLVMTTGAGDASQKVVSLTCQPSEA